MNQPFDVDFIYGAIGGRDRFQKLLAAASSIALFASALTLITPAVNAGTSCSTYGSTTYCN